MHLPVIFLSDEGSIVVDADELAKASVTALIVEQFKGKKQLVFKFKKRKGYKKLNGHRQQLTRLFVASITGADGKVVEAEIKGHGKDEEPEEEVVEAPEIVNEVVEDAPEAVEEVVEAEEAVEAAEEVAEEAVEDVADEAEALQDAAEAVVEAAAEAVEEEQAE